MINERENHCPRVSSMFSLLGGLGVVQLAYHASIHALICPFRRESVNYFKKIENKTFVSFTRKKNKILPDRNATDLAEVASVDRVTLISSFLQWMALRCMLATQSMEQRNQAQHHY